MAQNEKELSVALPESLRQQFSQVERRLWLVETTLAACFALGGLLFSFLVLFLLDRFFDTSVGMRLFLFLLGLSACVAAVCYWLKNWVWQRRDLRALAKLVQKKYRRLGDRLLGIVELSNEQRHLSNFSPALYHAAIDQVAGEAKAFDFTASVSLGLAKRFLATCAGLLIVIGAASVVLPQASWNSFCRWTAPTAKIVRYTLVGLDDLPAQLTVAHGEPFSIFGHAQYKTFWKPSGVKGQIGHQPRIVSSISGNALRLDLPGQMEESVLLVKVGDASRKIKISPQHRPSLKELTASLELPAYLEYPRQTETIRNGTLLVLEGSQVSIRAKMSRNLSSVKIQNESLELLPLTLTNEEFTSDLGTVSGFSQFTLNWQDEIKLSNTVPLHLTIQSEKDAAPTVDLPDLPRNISMLVSDVIPVRVESHDDFGIQDQGLTWEVISDAPKGNAVTAIKTMTRSHQDKKTEKTFQWSPSVFQVPPDSIVELQAYARDYFPEREQSHSPVYQIQVLSAEKHAELIRQKLESLLAGVEEVTRLQEKVVNNTREATLPTEKTEAQQANRLNQTKDDQLQNAEKLDQMAKDGQRMLQEAMKNPLIPSDAVRELARTMQQWQKLSQEKMQDAAKSLKSAQQNSKSREQDVAEALKKEEEILKDLEKQQSKNNEDMDQLKAMTLAQRLRKLATQETEVSEHLANSAEDTIGLLPSELPQKFKEMEASLTKGQVVVGKESETLAGEISRFSERTQKTNYTQVSKEMKEARIIDELEKLNGMIRDNVVMESSSQLTNWAGRFQGWGDLLEPKSDNAGGKGEGEGKGASEKKKDLGKQLIALLRLREKELTLRQQTSLLDQQKGDPNNYTQQTTDLLKDQHQASESLATIHKETDLEPLDKPFAETAAAMQEVENLLQKPQTDKATDEAQGKSLDLLTDLINLINEQAQRPPPQGQPQPSEGSAEEMAFLTQMMKEGKIGEGKPMQSPGGGNTAGGTTQRASTPTIGNTQGKNAAARSVGKAAGIINSAPAEFRDALENYYREMEKTTKDK